MIGTQQAWQDGRWQRPFFTIWSGQAASLFGSQLVGFALVWWLTAATGSATVLALSTLMWLLPQVVLGPIAGALIDRWNRRRTMIAADSLIALATAVLAALFAAGAAQTWHILALMMVRGLGGAFHFPAMQASTSLMVPARHLSRVAGINQTLQGLLTIASPPIGALLYGLLLLTHILLIDVATASLAIIPLLFIDVPQPARDPAAAPDERSAVLAVWRDMLDGFRYILAWPGLRAAIGIAVLVNLLGMPTSALVPLLVSDHFGGDALQLGALESGWGIGMLAGGLLLSVWGGFRRRVITCLLGVIGQGIGWLVLGLAPGHLLTLGLAGYVLVGFAFPLANGPLNAILQSTVTPDMQGRVFSLMQAAFQGVTPLSLLIIGPLADGIGVRPPLLLTGVGYVLLGAAGFFIPAIMTIETNQQGGQPEVPSPAR